MGRKRFYNLSRRLCISASKHCRKMKFRKYFHLTLVSTIYYYCHMILWRVVQVPKFRVEVYILGLECNGKLKFSMGTHLTI